MSQTIYRTLLVLLVIVIFIGLVLGIQLLTRDNSQNLDADITVYGNRTASLSVRLDDMVPGYEVSYTVHITAAVKSMNSLVMAFEGDGNNTLAPFIDVDLSVAGVSVGGGKLSDFLSGKRISHPLPLSPGEGADLVITYRMSADVGDEAQGASAAFQLLLAGEET